MEAIERCSRLFLRSLTCGSIILSALLLISCSSNDEDHEPEGTQPPNNVKPTVCKLTSITTNAAGKYDATKNYTLSYKLTYGYDDKGNLVSSTSSYNYKFSDGTT